MQAAQTTTPSFESVWALVKEVAENQKETDRQMKETDRQMKETDRQMKETDRQIKEYNRRFGEFTNRFGEIVEYMIAPNLCEKFKEFNLIFLKANSGTRVKDHENNIHFEIDIMLENGAMAMLVEVKTKPTTENIKEHIERLEKMRKYANLHDDTRVFLGGIAGVVMTDNVKDFALKQGLFVIEPSGETFFITPPNGNPKEW
jgi:Holliday junction resolvase-like predicted endonuclease